MEAYALISFIIIDLGGHCNDYYTMNNDLY